MVDNFAIPAATIRGLFDYEYRSDRLILRPRVPGSIAEYVQKHPVRFGEKTLYLTCRNGGPKIKSVTVNGKPAKTESPDAVNYFLYDDLPMQAKIEIVTEGGWASPARRTLSAAGRRRLPAGRDRQTEAASSQNARILEKALRRVDGDGPSPGQGVQREVRTHRRSSASQLKRSRHIRREVRRLIPAPVSFVR